MSLENKEKIIESIVNVLLNEVTGMVGAPMPSTMSTTASGSSTLSKTTGGPDDEDEKGGSGSLKTQAVAFAGATKSGTSGNSTKNVNTLKSVGFNQKVVKSKSPLGVFDANAEK